MRHPYDFSLGLSIQGNAQSDVEESLEVGVACETEAGHALLRAVGDQEGAIGKWRLQAA